MRVKNAILENNGIMYGEEYYHLGADWEVYESGVDSPEYYLGNVLEVWDYE